MKFTTSSVLAWAMIGLTSATMSVPTNTALTTSSTSSTTTSTTTSVSTTTGVSSTTSSTSSSTASSIKFGLGPESVQSETTATGSITTESNTNTWTTQTAVATGGLANGSAPIIPSDPNDTNRPSLGSIIKHLTENGKLTWEDHELGEGHKVAVYDQQDWHNAKAWLAQQGQQNSTQPTTSLFLPGPSSTPPATLGPRAPIPSGAAAVGGGGASSMAASGVPLAPVDLKNAVVASSTTTVSSGTSSAVMGDSTQHTTKWICNQPFNFMWNLGAGAFLGIVCNLAFTFIQNAWTARQGTLIQRTMLTAPQMDPNNPGRAANIAIHVEKYTFWPGLKAAGCSSLILQIINNAYCWGYGEGFSTSSRIKRQSTLPYTVGGTMWVYDTLGTSAVGLIEIEAID